MDACTITKNAVKLRKFNRFWRDPDTRARFEIETGMPPLLIGNSLEVEAQAQSGVAEEYHNRFRTWAFAQID